MHGKSADFFLSSSPRQLGILTNNRRVKFKMSENDQTLPDTDQRPKVSLTKREQIMRNADKILADMNLRKDVVGSLLTHKELQPNWAKVRQNSLNFNKSGQLLANPVVSKLFEEAEPLMNQFQVRWFKAKIPCPFRGWS